MKQDKIMPKFDMVLTLKWLLYSPASSNFKNTHFTTVVGVLSTAIFFIGLHPCMFQPMKCCIDFDEIL
jgi:hypothetical protein